MKFNTLLDQFDRIIEAPDAISRLRQFILDLAIRGKLVEQDSNDEPAQELLDRIVIEKEKKFPNQSKKHEILPVDKNGIGHEIPDTWIWVRLGDIFIYDAGIKTYPNDLPRDGWLLDLEDIEKDSGSVKKYVTVGQRMSKSMKSRFQSGDVLYGRLRPYLNKSVVAETEGFSTTEIVAFRCFGESNPHYTCLALRRPDFVRYVTHLGQGTKMPRLRREDAINALFPLPPLSEQQRIVVKVNELMVVCDGLEAAQQECEQLRDRLVAATLNGMNNGDESLDSTLNFKESARFYFNHLPRLTTRPEHIEELRKTILNQAVRGRLVEQDPEDEPASRLLDRIQAIKLDQFNEGDVKISKSLPPIDEAAAPFELPTGWAWSRFPELGEFGRGKSKHRPRNDPALFEGGSYLFIQTGDVARSNGVIETFTNKYNEVGLAQSRMWPKGTLCITIAANIADSGILTFDACFPDSVVGFIPSSVFSNARYFEYFMRTAKTDLLEYAPATAQKNINLGILIKVLIPLPPLLEQERIVAKLDELTALCDEMETFLATTSTTQGELLEAALYEALEAT